MLLLFLFSCGDNLTQKENNEIKRNIDEDSISAHTGKSQEESPVPPLVIKYYLDSLPDSKNLDTLFSMYDEDQKKVILALNRIEAARVGPGSVLLKPDTLLSDFNLYAPFPKLFPIFDSIPKTVLISQRVQAFALYEGNRLIKWGPVSSGKLSTPTPNGLHYGNYKAKRKISTVNESWILPYYFNFMNFEGVGVHQYLLPGFAASHACVRLYMEDARYIYEWADQWKLDPTEKIVIKNGTPFMVFGEYDFQEPYPWLKLVEDPSNNNLTKEEISILEAYVKQYFMDERNFSIIEDNNELKV